MCSWNVDLPKICIIFHASIFMRMFGGSNALSSLYLLHLYFKKFEYFHELFCFVFILGFNVWNPTREINSENRVIQKVINILTFFDPQTWTLLYCHDFYNTGAAVKLTILFCMCKIVRNINVTLFYSLIPIHYVGVNWNILIMTETRHKTFDFVQWFTAAVSSLVVSVSDVETELRCLNWFCTKDSTYRAACWHKRTISWSNIYWKLCDLDRQKKE